MIPDRRLRLAGACLVALALWLLRDVLFLGRSFFERDLLYYYFPLVEALVRSIAEGSLPLRDPTTGFGQPILGNPQSQALYPLTWLHLVFPPDRVFSFVTLAHFVLGASGASAMCFRMSRNRFAAFCAGAFWMVSGPFQSSLNLWHHFAGAAWMPWVLVAFDRLIESPDWPRARLLGAAFGLQILAGSGDLCAMTLLLALLRLISLRAGSPERAWRRLSLATLGSLLVGLSLGAGMWMPVAEVVRSSLRDRLPREVRTEWSIHPLVAGELVAPLQMGSLPLTAEARGRISDGRPPFLISIFLGPLILPLLGAGLANASVSRRDRVFLAVAGVAALLVSLGKYAPFYDVFVTLMPPLAMFRYPAKALLPLALFASVLAGSGVAALAESTARRVAGLLTALMLALDAWLFFQEGSVFAALLDRSTPGLVEFVLSRVQRGFLLCVLSLLVFGAALLLRRLSNVIVAGVLASLVATALINEDINATVPREVIRFRPGFVPLLKEGEPGRLYAYDYLHYPARTFRVLGRSSLIVPESAQGLDGATAAIVVVRSTLLPPTGGAWGIEYAWESDTLGLFDRALRDLSGRLLEVEGQPAFVRMLQIANVTRVVALHTAGFSELTLERTIPVPAPEPLHVYRVPEPLPRAYAVSGVRVQSAGEASATILDPGFDPRVEAVLGDGSASPISNSFTSRVAIAERKPDRVVLDATLNEPGYVVLVEGFLPGWRATVDDIAVPAQRANALFLAAAVPAGHHRVVFAYRPRGALAGIALSGVTAAALLLSLVRLRPKSD